MAEARNARTLNGKKKQGSITYSSAEKTRLVRTLHNILSSFRFVSPEEKLFVGPNEHSVLYNAMIHPFLKMTIYGAIWYQGEANTGAPYTYNCTFPAMIDDWRSKWFYGTDKLTDAEFPFGFVQVSNLS